MLDELFEWLVAGAPGVSTSLEIADRLASGIVAAGIPLARLVVFVETLHPSVLGRAFIWDGGKTKVGTLSFAVRNSAAYQHSPIAAVTRTRHELRWRAGEPVPYPAIQEQIDKGCVDYAAMPMPFVNGECHAIAFTSHSGFEDAHLAALRRLVIPLSRIAEIYALRRVAVNILDTYVGASSGARVLSGQILRGNVDIIRAAIWFSDLREFTRMSDGRPPTEVIALLNDVFDCQVPAIAARGGEVLKFIGDGMLAIFPISENAPAKVRCADALAASEAAFAALAALNARTSRSLQLGIGLHIGDVAYGNIGGESRLDFTAIGPAVNLASRLEGVTSKLGRARVVSAEFAAASERAFDDLGTFELKGIAQPQRVLG